MNTAEFIPPKPVQCWQADDHAHKGRFVSDLARPVVDLLAPKRGERILDLGCGDGVLAELIAASGADVLGADLSEELLAAAAAKGLKVQRVDGHALQRRVRRGLHQCSAALDAPAEARDRRRPPRIQASLALSRRIPGLATSLPDSWPRPWLARSAPER